MSFTTCLFLLAKLSTILFSLEISLQLALENTSNDEKTIPLAFVSMTNNYFICYMECFHGSSTLQNDRFLVFEQTSGRCECMIGNENAYNQFVSVLDKSGLKSALARES